LIQSERMASVGVVAAGIVHNLRNPLNGILGFGEFLLDERPDVEYLDQIVLAARQMNEMIENILAKSRQRGRSEPVDLNALLERELDFLEANRTFKYSVERDIDLADGLPPVTAVYTDLSQVFGNLLRNAVDAMYGRETKRLTVVSRLEDGHVAVEVGDTGCGIPEEHVGRLFDPFFTTKSPGEGEDGPVGTGLGLYMVQRLLEAYGATVAVDSTVGAGTTFRVRIPV